MAESTIHEICLREDQSGQFNFSFKALEGYMFTGDPYIYSINGQEWDTTGGVMTFSFGTDYGERWGDGLGVHGTQTVNITLNYDIPDLNPQDDNTNKIKIDFFVKKMLSYCLNGGYTYYLRFDGLGGAPIINGHTPVTGQTSATYWGQNKTGVYVFAGMAMGTYAWYVDSEADALTLYSEVGNINISATYSKTVFIRTSVYEGNVTLYWGTIVLQITGDFDKATMLFSNGHRNTLNWVRYNESCAFNFTYNPKGRGFTKTLVTRRDDCELWATNEQRRELINATGGIQLVSNTNGYSFSQVRQGRGRADSDDTHIELIEPYGRLYRRGNTLISVKAYGTIAYGTWQDVSHDNGETWTRIDDTRYSVENARPYWLWSDIVYAGFSETENNHVWYALAHFTGYGAAINGSYHILKSVDDAASFDKVIDDSGDLSPDFQDITADPYYLWNGQRGRLFVDLDKDYIFVFFYQVHKKITYTTHTNPQFILYRGFPSQESSANGVNMKPVIAADAQTGGVSSTYNGIDFDYEDVIIVDRGMPEPHLPLSINDNGLCIFTTRNHYLVSWNFGLNWTEQENLPTITQTHTNGNTYTYPEYSPTPVFWQGKNLILTSHTRVYSSTHNTNYRKNSIANVGLLYGVMEVPEKNEESWITGDIPESWDDYQTFGVPSGLMSTQIGPYSGNWRFDAVIYGDNILHHNSGYDLDLDSTYGTFYWYSWDIVNATTTATGNSADQTPAGLSLENHTAYGNNILATGDVNGVVSDVDEDWVLFQSTDNGTNFTSIYTHPNNTSYIKSIHCESDGTDPFIGVFISKYPKFVFSLDSGSTFNTYTNHSYFESYSASPKIEYTDGYLWIMESWNYSGGKKSWILPANQTVLSDASNWSTYEVPSTSLVYASNPVRQFAAHGQKGVIQHGNFNYYTTTDRGQTWTNINSITTTDGVSYSATDLQYWNYGLNVNKHTGEFIFHVGNNAYPNSFLITSDFITYKPLAYVANDPNGDNNPDNQIMKVLPAPNGNWYALIKEDFRAKPRLFNLTESIPTAPPTLDRIVDDWEIIKEYTVTDTNSATNPNYASDGHWSAHTMNITKDYEFSDGIPRLMITRPYAIDIIPEPPAPTIVNGSLEEEITYPAFPPAEDLVYDLTVGHMRWKHIYSDKPFGVMYIDRNERLHKMDGIFNIITMSITEPIVIKSQDDQVINYGLEEEIPIDTVVTAGTSVLYPSMTYTHNYGGHGFAFVFGTPGNPTIHNHVENHGILANNVGSLSFFLNRDDVPNRQNITRPNIATSYLSDFARPIPSGYFFRNIQTLSAPVAYGNNMIFFPPQDRVYINVVGMKLYSDPYGTPFLDGYYKVEDIINDYFGHYNTANGRDGIWENIEETDYMVVKNGIVIEVGHSKNLPDYDQC